MREAGGPAEARKNCPAWIRTMKRGSKDLCDTISPQGKREPVSLDQSSPACKSRHEKIFLCRGLMACLAGDDARRLFCPAHAPTGSAAGGSALGRHLPAGARLVGDQGRGRPPHPARRHHARHRRLARAAGGRRAVLQQAAAHQLADRRIVPVDGYPQRVGPRACLRCAPSWRWGWRRSGRSRAGWDPAARCWQPSFCSPTSA